MPNAKLPLQSQVVFQVWWSTSIIQKLLEAYSSFPTFFHHLVPVFCIQVAAFRHFIQQFDLLHRKILAVPFFPNFSEVVVHLIFYHTTCHHLLTDLHLWSTPHLSKVRLSQTSGGNSKDSPIWNKETSSHFGKHVEIGLESRWGSWEFAFHPSRPWALCSVSSSQIASSPGEKFHRNLCFFFELIILKSSQFRQRYGRSPTVLRITIVLNIFQTPTHQLSPLHLPQNTSPQLNLSKLQQSALGVLSLREEMISWTSQNILLENDNFRVPPEETPWCKDYIYRYSLRYEFRRLQYLIKSSSKCEAWRQ